MIDKEKEKLLKELEQEEAYQEEEIEFPEIEYNPAKKIAEIFKNRKTAYLDIAKLGGLNISDAWAAYYLIENLDNEQTAYYLSNQDRHNLSRLLLVDITAGLIGKSDYSNTEAIERLSVRIAGDIYHNMFTTLCEPIYINPIEFSEKEIRSALSDEEEHDMFLIDEKKEIFEHFRGESLEVAIAASRLAEYMEDVDERLRMISDVTGLRYLFGSKLYYEMVRDDEIKNEIKQMIDDFTYTMSDVFVYSILKLHKDFFKKMEE